MKRRLIIIFFLFILASSAFGRGLHCTFGGEHFFTLSGVRKLTKVPNNNFWESNRARAFVNWNGKQRTDRTRLYLVSNRSSYLISLFNRWLRIKIDPCTSTARLNENGGGEDGYDIDGTCNPEELHRLNKTLGVACN